MNRQDHIQKINNYLGRLIFESKAANASGLFDINKISEDFYIPILKLIFNCPNLRNLNQIQANFPSVDLGCDMTRIAFQLSSDASSAKVAETLKKFRVHGLEKDFDVLYVFIITEKQTSYNAASLRVELAQSKIGFDPDTHVIDYKDIVSQFGKLKTSDIILIANILETEFAKADHNLRFRHQLDNFLNFTRSKIDNEKKTKKYIPSIFVETSKAKDLIRYFANPLFFHRKVTSRINQIDIRRLNNLLEKAQVKAIDSNFLQLEYPAEAKEIKDLNQIIRRQASALRIALDVVTPFSYDWKRSQVYNPGRDNQRAWEIFKYAIMGVGNEIHREIEENIERLELIDSKICLVTGKAGQGKTNFVCDLIERQFAAFKTPVIFIPARELNHYTGPNRILQFIKNNRYAPIVEDLHELFDLFDNIAIDNNNFFIIVIDGINELNELAEFNAELKIFFDALCQYDFVKVIVTCRIEFFDQRYANLLEEGFSKYIFRIQDLKSEMSSNNLDRLLQSYMNYFKINLILTNLAKSFLTNDLLLLRIFCENNEGRSGGKVSSIYKSELFEEFLNRKIKEFPSADQARVMPTIFKIIESMVATNSFSNQTIHNFDAQEDRIVDRLISDDIILRRELSSPDLFSAGKKTVSFTYDELRDFIIGYHLVGKEKSGLESKAIEFLGKIPDHQVHEGVFRYVYILSRKLDCQHLVTWCEGTEYFIDHYVHNIDLLPANIQTQTDVQTVRRILATSKRKSHLREVAVFLFLQRSTEHLLHIGILVEHINTLTDIECELFLEIIFNGHGVYQSYEWRNQIAKLLKKFISKVTPNPFSEGAFLVAFIIQIACFSEWIEREDFKNWIAEQNDEETINAALELIDCTQSTTIKVTISEIRLSREPTNAG